MLLCNRFTSIVNLLLFCLLADSVPEPVTPDYGEPLVCYADGVFDPRINRYVTVQEGTISIYYFKEGL